ncbi:MAG TPA: PaaI family thioesterase [Noviherbaspirillum sp.]|uniref:PaaI family thioesterase n=1 Tax=Noviherbaspirillum sp. TaxID=1926288 RepID=UPI002B47BE16|nr:PaaI family thioesterase [Noviherbaspirillum sp.]HJV86176.1 PaaI family thioesterase [Noviherbaspirillum sp.]
MQNLNTLESFNQRGKPFLPGLLGIVVTGVGKETLNAELTVQQSHLAPNGYLHAGSVVTLADTACGYACIVNLPEGASSFTTIELKSNFIGTAREGVIECEAKAVHTGRNTQVWDAQVRHRDTGKLIATFRCTQMILWPK